MPLSDQAGYAGLRDKVDRQWGRLILNTAVLTLLAAAGVGAAVGFTVFRAGWSNIGATSPHFKMVYRGLEQAMRYSVRHHAKDVKVPQLDQAAILRGAAVYRDNCAQCHGGPGVAPQGHGLSMQPAPGPLVDCNVIASALSGQASDLQRGVLGEVIAGSTIASSAGRRTACAPSSRSNTSLIAPHPFPCVPSAASRGPVV